MQKKNHVGPGFISICTSRMESHTKTSGAPDEHKHNLGKEMAVSCSLAVTTPNANALRTPNPKFTLYSSNSKPINCNSKLPLTSISATKKSLIDIGIGVLAASVLALTPLDANATRIEYYATVGEPLCELAYAKSGLGYCDILEGPGDEVPYGELINVSASFDYPLAMLLNVIL